MYCIEINYSTGNTFGTYEATELVYSNDNQDPVIFQDLDSAKLALQCIKEHTNMMQGTRYLTNKEREIHKDKMSMQLWACKSRYSDSYESSLKVPVSKECVEWVEIYAFWRGYFETIHSAKIIISTENVNDDDMIVYF